MYHYLLYKSQSSSKCCLWFVALLEGVSSTSSRASIVVKWREWRAPMHTMYRRVDSYIPSPKHMLWPLIAGDSFTTNPTGPQPVT